MRRPQVGILALAMLALACAVPTEAPNWDMTWNIPVPDKGALSIGVSSFLPSGVTLVSSGGTPTAFNAAVNTIPPITRSLAQQCVNAPAPGCQNGSFPFPGFTAPTSSTTVNLASGTSLQSATIASGSQLSIGVQNTFSFDPLKPPGSTVNGSFVMTITNGTTTLGTCTLVAGSAPAGCTTSNGASALPAGATTTLTIPLTNSISASQPITVSMNMVAPSTTTFVSQSPATQFITATPSATINISTATVTIPAQTVQPTSTPIDLSGVDSTITQRIVNDASTRGTMYLTITNPFTVGGTPTLTFQATGVSIQKSVTLTPATNATTPSVTTQAISFTGVQLRQILGKNLTAVFAGTTAAGSTAVTPAMKISGTSRMQLNFTLQEQKP